MAAGHLAMLIGRYGRSRALRIFRRKLQRLLLLFAGEVATRQLRTEIGPERLSLQRLRDREQHLGGAYSRTQLARFRHTVDELDEIIAALNPPDDVVLRGEHVIDGEELVLLLYRRFVSTDSNTHLADEVGRSEAAISEAVRYAVEWLLAKYLHLVDERGFLMFERHFDAFAAAYTRLGMPVPGMVVLVDGKLYETCRPVREQDDAYSGHHKSHGAKCLGLTFPNGLLPYATFDPHGRRHDAHRLAQSGLLPMLAAVSQRRGTMYRAGADSAFPVHPHCTPMYRGVLLAGLQRVFNRNYSPVRIQVEWGFGLVVTLFPYMQYRLKLKMLLQPVGLLLPVAVLLTNIHTCLRGNAISHACGLSPPSLRDYLAGRV